MAHIDDEYSKLIDANANDPAAFPVDPGWLGNTGFAQFLADLGPPPTDDHLLCRGPSPHYPWTPLWDKRNCFWRHPLDPSAFPVGLSTIGGGRGKRNGTKKLRAFRMHAPTGREVLPD
jgi:hypothetical protein